MDYPYIAGGERTLRPGNAAGNTTTDHITILGLALAALPEHDEL